MVYLLACILSSTSIYVIFRLAKNYSCNLSSLITLNYFVGSFLGLSVFMHFDISLLSNSKPWIPYGILLGILFIIMFYFIGVSSQKAGITVTTLANKLSLIFPILFSLLYFHEKITTLQFVGIGTAIASIILTVYKKEIKKTNLVYIVLPVIIFLGSGFTDSVVKFIQGIKINEDDTAIFSFVVFSISFILGLIISITSKKSNNNNKLHSPTLFLGTLLGLVNFGSLYFLILALNNSNFKSSLVFAIVNISIVMLSAIIGRLVFNEKLNKINTIGLILAIVSLYFLL